MHLALFTPELPPARNGIGDYTHMLAQQLVATGQQVTLLTGSGIFDCPKGCQLNTFAYEPKSLSALSEAVAQSNPDWLILQYNPFMYARWGINPWLIGAVAQCRRQFPQLKLALMAHEVFLFPENLRGIILGPLQRFQLQQLLRYVDVAFGSIEPYTKILQELAPHKPIISLPVGSNIPCYPLLPPEKITMRAELGLPATAIVLGAFGSSPVLLMETVGFAVLQALRQEGLAAYLLLVGSGGDRTLALSPKSLQPWIKTTGFVDIARASHALQTIDLFLAAYPDGISARRTSAIAGMAHGLPLFSSSGRLSDRFWQVELPENIVPAESLAQLTPLVVRAARDLNFRSQLAEATAAVYERHFTWTGIVARMLGFLNTVVS